MNYILDMSLKMSKIRLICEFCVNPYTEILYWHIKKPTAKTTVEL